MLGTAFVFNILFKIPMWVGVILTVFSTLLLLGVQRFGIHKHKPLWVSHLSMQLPDCLGRYRLLISQSYHVSSCVSPAPETGPQYSTHSCSPWQATSSDNWATQGHPLERWPRAWLSLVCEGKALPTMRLRSLALSLRDKELIFWHDKELI